MAEGEEMLCSRGRRRAVVETHVWDASELRRIDDDDGDSSCDYRIDGRMSLRKVVNDDAVD